MIFDTHTILPAEDAAFHLAEAQHAPGVTCRMDPDSFRVEYIRPDGTLVPSYEYYLELALKGELHHDTN